MSRELTWQEEKARSAVKNARNRAGTGWNLLGEDIQRALVSDEIVSLALMQAEETLEKNPALAKIVEVARLAFSSFPSR